MRLTIAIRSSIILLLLCSGYGSRAYYYKQYTTSNGLISNNVYHAFRDSKGYMWFFTDKGVSRCDGTTFRNYTVSDGLSDQDIFSGYEDRMGRLWLYTFNGNPCYIKDDKVYNATNDPLLNKLPVNSYMEYIYEDADSSFYIAYQNGPVMKVLRNSYKWVIASHGDADPLYSMHRSGDTLIVNRQSTTIALVNDKVVRADKTPRNLNFHDYDKLLRIDDEGIKVFSNNRLEWEHADRHLNFENVLHMYCDNKGHVFCGTNNGLVIVDKKTKKKETLLENFKVSSVNEDLYGNYWVTTHGNGVFRLNKELNAIRPLKEIDGHEAYIANNRQLFFLKGTNVYSFNHGSPTFVSNTVKAGSSPLYIDDRYFYFAEGNYTYRLNRDNGKTDIIYWLLKGMYRIDSTRFLLQGLDYISQARSVQNKLTALDTTFFLRFNKSCFHNGSLYFYSNNVIYSYTAGQRSITRIDSLNEHRSIGKLYFIEDKLIITTNGENVIYYSEGASTPLHEKELKRYPFVCYDIMRTNIAGSRYLLHTSKGYYLVNTPGDIPGNMQLLEYPLAGEDIHSLNIVGNEVVCDLNGAYYTFDVGLINKEKKRPKFFIERASVNGKEYLSRDLQIKNSAHTHLSIGLDHLRPDAVPCSYEYRIIHDDTSQWFGTSSDKLDVFLERYGDHIIELRARTENNVVSRSRYLTLDISPPFYYSFDFYVLVAISLLLLLGLAIKMYDRHRSRAFQNELNYLQLEHRSMNSLLNPHFIFNAINNIQNLININSKEDANNYLVILSRLIRQNIENLQFSFITVSRELDLVRNYIMLQNLRFDNRIHLTIQDHTRKADDIQVPPLLIHTFVENSVVHGFRKDKHDFTISIDLELTIDDLLIIRVLDNGAGISEDKNKPADPEKTSLGIELIRKRLSRLSDLYKVTFSLSINDIGDGNVTGTEVVIVLYSKFGNDSNGKL